MEPRKVASEIEIEYCPDLLALDLACGGVCFYVEETIQTKKSRKRKFTRVCVCLLRLDLHIWL